MTTFIPLLQDRANELLGRFVPWTEIALRLDRQPVYSSSKRNNKFSTGTVSLKVTFKGTPLTRLDGFLNEARITAIALSLFLAAMTLSTPPKLADGTYGSCDSCGRHIAAARLEALPWASLCIACASRR